MVKTLPKQSNSQPQPQPQPQIHKTPLKGAHSQRSKQKQAQFFGFLKELHGVERRGRKLTGEEQCWAKEIMDELYRFFNIQKKYGEGHLERYVMHLANLLNLLAESAPHFSLGGEFRRKIRRFLRNVSASKAQAKCKHSKIHAVLYILAILIYRQKPSDQGPALPTPPLHSDKILVKLLLGLRVAKFKRMDKFYGLIIMHLASQHPTPRIQQLILSSVLSNFSAIQHEPTFYNMLVLLRSLKNRVSVNFKDVIEGGIFDLLLQNCPRYLDQPTSYYGIDYLTYLLTLFPALASKVPKCFISNMLSLPLPNTRHPLLETSLISFAELALKYSPHQETMLSEIVDVALMNKPVGLKLAHLLGEYQVVPVRMMELLQSGYFLSLLQQINSQSDAIEVKRISQICIRLANKLHVVNSSVGEYMKQQVQMRVRVLEGRRLV